MKKKNSYEKKAQKKQLLDGVAAEHAKGDIKKSALETGRDILVGAIGGGLAGAVLGRSSGVRIDDGGQRIRRCSLAAHEYVIN